MGPFLFTVLLIAAAAFALLVFRFTENGTVPVREAYRKATVWLSLVGGLAGGYIVDLASWVASFWEPLQAQFGAVLGADNAGMALQAVSMLFFIVRMKGQGGGAPKVPELPPIP